MFDPKIVETLASVSVKKIACGLNTLALTYRGDLYHWGPIAESKHKLIPEKIEMESSINPIRDISCGYDLNAAIDIENTLLVWTINHPTKDNSNKGS